MTAAAETPLLDEVYATYGLALHRAQSIEHGIIKALVWLGVGDGDYRAFEESEAANASLFKQTMGKIKNLLIDRMPILEHLDITDSLLRAVRLRNFLAHEYFRQRAIALLFREGQQQMLEELNAALAYFEEVAWSLDMVVNGRLRDMGLEAYDDDRERPWKRGYGDPLPGLPAEYMHCPNSA